MIQRGIKFIQRRKYMKKLLLFIFVLFCVSTSLSYANACNSQICTCPNGSWVTFGQYCSAVVNTTPTKQKARPVDWIIFAYSPSTGNYGLAHNKNKNIATQNSLEYCGVNDCKVLLTNKAYTHGVVVTSSNGIYVAEKYNGFSSIIGKRPTAQEKEQAYFDKLVSKCTSKGGIKCKVFFDSYEYSRKMNLDKAY